MRILGLIAGFLGAIILSVGALLTWQILQQVAVLCPDDAACSQARGAALVAAVGALSGLVTLIVGFLLRRRAS